MIICPNCSRENEDHYKFCLGCGTELSKVVRADAPTALPAARPIAAPAPRPIGVSLVRAPMSAPVAPVAPVAAPAAPPPAEVVLPPVEVALPPPVVTPPIEPVAPPPAMVVDDHPFTAATPPPAEVPPDVSEPTLTVNSSDLAEALAAQAGSADSADLPFDLSMDGSVQAQDLAAAAALVAEVDVPLPVGAMMATGQMETPTLRETSGVGDAVLAALEQGIPVETTAPGAQSNLPDARLCGSCGAAVPEGFKFCGVCGTRYEQRHRPAGQVFVPNVQDVSQAPARLNVIHPDATEGEVFPLGGSATAIGRSHPSSIFSEDPFLSPRHATFYFVKGQLFARDEGSLNGVFVRIKAEVELFHGDMFRIGQQLLRFEEMAQVRPVLPGAGDGTTVMGSPLRGAWGRLGSIVALNTPASVWVLRRPEEHMGRERGEITFPDDGFVSGGHCKVSTRDGRFFLRDLDSTNGTYLRVKAEGILAQGDLILLGQQLFKIDLSH